MTNLKAPSDKKNNKKSGVVVLLGRPNVGKSTLLNAVLKENISIVTPKAQTTRDQIRGIYNGSQGQIVFIDTPGVHKAREGGINAYMVQEVRRALDGPDVVIYLIDPFSKVEAEKLMLEYLKVASSNLIILVNKADFLPSHPERFLWLDAWIDEVKSALAETQCKWVSTISTSAIKGKGVDDLLELVYDLLPIAEPLYPLDESITDRSMRFVVAELIRKQLFMNLGDEITYSCAVEIEEYQETKKPIIISLGLCSLEDVKELVAFLKNENASNVILLKYTSTYPAMPKDCNVNTIHYLRE